MCVISTSGIAISIWRSRSFEMTKLRIDQSCLGYCPVARSYSAGMANMTMSSNIELMNEI